MTTRTGYLAAILSLGLLLGLAGSGFAAGPNPSNVISMAPPPTDGGPVMVSLGYWMQIFVDR